MHLSVKSNITSAGNHHFQETEKVIANGRGSKITVGLCALSVSTISARPCCHTFVIEAYSRIARYPCAFCASIITTESSMCMFMVEGVGCRDGRPKPYSIQKKVLKTNIKTSPKTGLKNKRKRQKKKTKETQRKTPPIPPRKTHNPPPKWESAT